MALLAVLVIASTESAAQTADAMGHSALVVRTFDRFGVSGMNLVQAQAEVSVILDAAGIDVSWLDCWDVDKEPPGASPRCRQPLGLNEVILRIQPSNAAPGRSIVSMGFSLVRCQDSAPSLSTVYADEVASVASRAGVDPRALLGRAIAHEIGHLLLDTNQHAKTGLMRAVWSQAELRRNQAADWSFQEEEARTMRAAISTRMISAN